MRRKLARTMTLALFCAALANCGGDNVRDRAPSGNSSIPNMPGDAIPRDEPRSRYGNGPEYEVFGKRYTVMPSGNGYAERGVASWYGKKFHGRLTSNRETYDMYQMTAAHKSLPLPSYVRVRNLRNDKSIVVRVNDRGPFVHNRIIDLSYAAALRLDMVRDGTSLVEVTAITFDEPAGDRPTRTITSGPSPTPEPVQTTPPPPPIVEQAAQTSPQERPVYVQVGAFGDRANAERRHRVLTERGIANSFVHADTSVTPTLFRVRVGPIVEVIQYDILVEELENVGILDPYLVTD